MIDSTLIERLQSFIESEGKSCSCDPELINPLYVYRMWGGSVAIEDIAAGLMELRKNLFMVDMSIISRLRIMAISR